MINKRWGFLTTSIVILIIVLLFLVFKPIFLTQGDLRLFIQSTGVAAPLIFIVLQLIQTIVPFVPGGLLTLSGGGICLGFF